MNNTLQTGCATLKNDYCFIEKIIMPKIKRAMPKINLTLPESICIISKE